MIFCIGFSVGIFFFTLIEWSVHKYLFHKWPSIIQQGHFDHHRNPTGYYTVPFFTTGIIVLTLLVILPGTVSVVYGFVSGLLFGHIIYGLFHHYLHRYHFRAGYFRVLQNHHDLHHADESCNYGVTSGFWDRIFRTFRT